MGIHFGADTPSAYLNSVQCPAEYQTLAARLLAVGLQVIFTSDVDCLHNIYLNKVTQIRLSVDTTFPMVLSLKLRIILCRSESCCRK